MEMVYIFPFCVIMPHMNKEPVTLRHPDVYQMDEWHELCARTRSNLMLVAEGYRPASCVDFEVERTALTTVLEKLELYYCFEEPYYHFVSSTEESLRTYGSPLYHVAPNPIRTQMLGELLGYPACCVKNFVDNGKNRKNSDFQKLVKQDVLPITLPDDLAFIQHSPCDIDCHATLRQGKLNRALLKTADPLTHDMAMLDGILRWANDVNQNTVCGLVGKYGRDIVLNEAPVPLRKPTDEVLREKYRI